MIAPWRWPLLKLSSQQMTKEYLETFPEPLTSFSFLPPLSFPSLNTIFKPVFNRLKSLRHNFSHEASAGYPSARHSTTAFPRSPQHHPPYIQLENPSNAPAMSDQYEYLQDVPGFESTANNKAIVAGRKTPSLGMWPTLSRIRRLSPGLLMYV